MAGGERDADDAANVSGRQPSLLIVIRAIQLPPFVLQHVKHVRFTRFARFQFYSIEFRSKTKNLIKIMFSMRDYSAKPQSTRVVLVGKPSLKLQKSSSS